MFIFFFFSVSIFAKNLKSNAEFWGLNDVTYIMPLPVKADQNNLLKMNSAGANGVLVSEKIVMQLPFMDMQHDKNQIFQMSRLMAVRIDPCFPLPTPLSCQKQIRMVWQPVLEKDGIVSTVDAAFHSFYVLSDSEFNFLLSDLKKWKIKFQSSENDSSKTPLDIHPFLKNEKDQSQALLELNTVFLKYAGDSNLSRVTVMVLRRKNDVWGFLGAEIKEGQIVAGAIPRLEGKTSQMFFNFFTDINQFSNATMNPKPLMSEANLAMFVEKASQNQTFTEQEIVGHLQSAYAIENPNLHNPESMDCVNCHIAQLSREWLFARSTSSTLSLDQNLFKNFKYTNSKYNLENKSVFTFNTHQLRGIGYFNENLAISQRVINESAIVADWINSNFVK